MSYAQFVKYVRTEPASMGNKFSPWPQEPRCVCVSKQLVAFSAEIKANRVSGWQKGSIEGWISKQKLINILYAFITSAGGVL